MTSAKDPQSFMKVQNEIFQNSIATAFGNWKETMAEVVSSQEAYRTLAEETTQLAKSNLEQTEDSIKKTTEAVEKAVEPTVK